MTTNGPTSGPMPPTAQPAQPAAFGSPSQRKDGRADGFALSSRATATRSPPGGHGVSAHRAPAGAFRRVLRSPAGRVPAVLHADRRQRPLRALRLRLVGVQRASGPVLASRDRVLRRRRAAHRACRHPSRVRLLRASARFGRAGAVEAGGPVVLPPELAETSAALNAIKLENERSERAAHAAEQRKNELVVYLAHDIKTPLTSIVGYLTLLDESPDLPVGDARPLCAHHAGEGVPPRRAARRVLRDHALQPFLHPPRAVPLRRSAVLPPGHRGVLSGGGGARAGAGLRRPRRAGGARRREAHVARGQQRAEERRGLCRPGHARGPAHVRGAVRRRDAMVGGHRHGHRPRGEPPSPGAHLRTVLPRRRRAHGRGRGRRARPGHRPRDRARPRRRHLRRQRAGRHVVHRVDPSGPCTPTAG